MEIEDLDKKQIHLTNVAINKKTEGKEEKNEYAEVERANFGLGGTKISLRMLEEKLGLMNVGWSEIWRQVGEICGKSLIACQPDIAHNPNCFELFGYDIMVDQDCKCWLIEVNQSPSLATDTFLDDLMYPTGLALWKNGAFIASVPDVFFAEDTDGERVRKRFFNAFRGRDGI